MPKLRQRRVDAGKRILFPGIGTIPKPTPGSAGDLTNDNFGNIPPLSPISPGSALTGGQLTDPDVTTRLPDPDDPRVLAQARRKAAKGRFKGGRLSTIQTRNLRKKVGTTRTATVGGAASKKSWSRGA
jgi:hypothetical protein